MQEELEAGPAHRFGVGRRVREAIVGFAESVADEMPEGWLFRKVRVHAASMAHGSRFRVDAVPEACLRIY